MQEIMVPGEAEIEIRHSRFIGYLSKVASRADAQAALADIRARHPGARHVCWVLLAGGESGMHDDGEPAGTAARPIYLVLQHHALVNVLAVVVRYFGGVRLGAGGLVRAYTQATVAALGNARIEPVRAQSTLTLRSPFALEDRLRRYCARNGGEIVSADYGEAVVLSVRVAADEVPRYRQDLPDVFAGAVEFVDSP
ncbi:IMPACT family protein [Crenobacter caeni]|uniref:YigZ family protein n=1 Tax=Crenobacter caeni TaxID=2705474 RepID=A0A6B2KQY4_9NEIS|nr:YigZ family protein [Crenobacter caeni]NDV12646.1 YigZ family protein [Crenobacter caeni]